MLERLKQLDERFIDPHLWPPDRAWPQRWERRGSPSRIASAAHGHPLATQVLWTLAFFVAGAGARPFGALVAGGSPDFAGGIWIGLAFAVAAVIPVHRRVSQLRRAYTRWFERRGLPAEVPPG